MLRCIKRTRITLMTRIYADMISVKSHKFVCKKIRENPRYQFHPCSKMI